MTIDAQIQSAINRFEGLKHFDSVLANLLRNAAARKKGDFFIEASQPNHDLFQAFISPYETIVVKGNELTDEMVGMFTNSLTDRFVAVRQHVVILVHGFWSAKRTGRIEIATERRRHGTKVSVRHREERTFIE